MGDTKLTTITSFMASTHGCNHNVNCPKKITKEINYYRKEFLLFHFLQHLIQLNPQDSNFVGLIVVSVQTKEITQPITKQFNM